MLWMKIYLSKFWTTYFAFVVVFLLVVSLGNKGVIVFADILSAERSPLIVIDAGHGGEDGGAISCTGKLESQLNLEIALRLNDLCHLLGYETKMIRTTDISVYTEGKTIAAKKASDLRQRVKIANETPNSIIISIHQNTFSDSRYSGAQVFYAKTAGSKELANILQRKLTLIDPQNHRREKEAGSVYLMQHLQNTGILIECGFLSNPKEEAILQNASYQKMLCAVIVSSLCEYTNA